MFTIQFEMPNGEHKTQEFNSNSRVRLVGYLAQFAHPIIAVYEQASPITKTIKRDLAEWPGSKTHHARAFIKTPA